LRVSVEVGTPFLVEDIGVVGVGLEEQTIPGYAEDDRMLGELSAAHGVAAVDGVAGPKALDAGRGGV